MAEKTISGLGWGVNLYSNRLFGSCHESIATLEAITVSIVHRSVFAFPDSLRNIEGH